MLCPGRLRVCRDDQARRPAFGKLHAIHSAIFSLLEPTRLAALTIISETVAANGAAAREDIARRTSRQTWSSLPKEAAVEFATFCTRNPKPCPLIEITAPGDPEPVRSAPGADLRTDLTRLPRLPLGRTGRAAGRNPRPLARRSRCLPSRLQPDLRARLDRSGGWRGCETWNAAPVPMFVSNLACRTAASTDRWW